jgi:hypothetical protein
VGLGGILEGIDAVDHRLQFAAGGERRYGAQIVWALRRDAG